MPENVTLTESEKCAACGSLVEFEREIVWDDVAHVPICERCWNDPEVWE